jgi:4-diphosphocytidyl-2-C-methyl-D-erythritol kinase
MLDQAAGAVTEIAPAKLNLALHVTGRRDDGYHFLESLVVFTDLADRLFLADEAADRFDARGPFSKNLPACGDNLIVKARDRLRSAFPGNGTRPVSIVLEKKLPVASGIGGGSSDAAAAIRGLARLWRLDADAGLARAGASLGADVAMCLAAKPLIARGIGERIELVPDFPELPLVLVNPGIAVSTPEVFAILTDRDNGGLPALPKRLDFGAVCDWLRVTRNDLQPPAMTLEPMISQVLDELRGTGAAFARMSGSGATCYGLCPSRAAADRAAAEIRRRHPGWFVKSTYSTSSETNRVGQD